MEFLDDQVDRRDVHPRQYLLDGEGSITIVVYQQYIQHSFPRWLQSYRKARTVTNYAKNTPDERDKFDLANIEYCCFPGKGVAIGRYLPHRRSGEEAGLPPWRERDRAAGRDSVRKRGERSAVGDITEKILDRQTESLDSEYILFLCMPEIIEPAAGCPGRGSSLEQIFPRMHPGPALSLPLGGEPFPGLAAHHPPDISRGYLAVGRRAVKYCRGVCLS